jgi:hypothetical protein
MRATQPWFNSPVKIFIYKYIVLCIMVFAIPAQGFAGTVLGFCHSGQAPAQSSVQVQMHVHDHGHESKNESLPDQGDLVKVSDVSQSKCSGCGPCCVGLALGSSDVSLYNFVWASADFAQPVFFLTSPPVTGLERPPRVIRA